MSRSRRAVLATLAAGTATLSGCSSLADLLSDERPVDGSEPSSERTTQTASSSSTTSDTSTDASPDRGGEWPDPPTDDHDRTYSVTSLEPAGRTLALPDTTVRIRERTGGPFRDGERGGHVSVAAAFARPATDEHPALLRTALRADWRAALDPDARTLDLTTVPFFDDHEFGPFVLAPTAAHDLVDPADVPEYERGPDGGWRLRWAPDTWLPERVDVSPHKLIHGEYRVLRGMLETAPVDPGRTTISPSNGGYRDDPLLSLAVWETDAPGPTGRSRFHGRSVPPLPGSVETVWYHPLDPTASVFLRPATERVSLPGRLRFDLVNHSESPVRSVDGLAVYKRHGGEWFRIRTSSPRWASPSSSLERAATLPGGVQPFERAVFAGEGLAVGTPRVGHLGAGTYAFSVAVESEASNPPHDISSSEGTPRGRFGALVELTGPETTVEPHAGVAVSRDGSTVTVRTTTPGTDTVTAVVERVDAAEQVVLAEQVMHGENDVLRNTLPFFEPDVERVRVETAPGVVATALGGKPPARFRYRGEPFRLTVER